MDIMMNRDGDAMFINSSDISSMVTRKATEVVAQRLKIRLRTWLGEWFINTTYGVPYYERVFKKQSSKTTVDNIFREQILQEPGVLELLTFNSTLDAYTRTYSASLTVRTEEGSASISVSV